MPKKMLNCPSNVLVFLLAQRPHPPAAIGSDSADKGRAGLWTGRFWPPSGRFGPGSYYSIRLRKKAIQDLGRTGLQARRADGRPKHKLLSVLGRASGRGGRVYVKASNSESRGCAALLCARPDGVSGESLRLSGAAATPLFIHHYSTPPRKGRAFPHSGAAQPLVFTQTLKPRPFGARAPTLFPHPAMCCAHVAVVIPGP